ncbi:MAG: hypothetical protein KJZ47_13965 [Gemmatimonadales bacterium]|nr:hypothetical protein [Gemmatimonadales bacterium]
MAATALALAGCEKKDASYTTSPSLKALVGTTTGNAAFRPEERAPEPVEPPADWQVEFALARFAELENGNPALEIVMQVKTRPGTGMELWISDEAGTVARWSGGSTAVYVGTVCFQLELERDGEAVPLGTGTHTATLAFREPVDGVIAARRLEITHTTPALTGETPALGSTVFSTAWACRRGQ